MANWELGRMTRSVSPPRPAEPTAPALGDLRSGQGRDRRPEAGARPRARPLERIDPEKYADCLRQVDELLG